MIDIEEDYQLFLKDMIAFHKDCMNTTGCYGFVDGSGKIYYIGSSYNHPIVDRCSRYKQPLNYSRRIMDRGHLWDFIRTIRMTIDNTIRYDLYAKDGQEERKRYYLDYWIENDKNKNDGLINFFKLNHFLYEIVNGRGYLEVVFLSRDSSKEEEQRLIELHKPACNMEFQLDEQQRYDKHEHQRIVFWDNIEMLDGKRPQEPLQVFYTRTKF